MSVNLMFYFISKDGGPEKPSAEQKVALNKIISFDLDSREFYKIEPAPFKEAENCVAENHVAAGQECESQKFQRAENLGEPASD